MTVWIATIDWDNNPDTGLPRQGYTASMPTREEAEQRILDCIRVASDADPQRATVISYSRTNTATRATLNVAGEQFDYRVIEHEGTMRNPGPQVQENNA